MHLRRTPHEPRFWGGQVAATPPTDGTSFFSVMIDYKPSIEWLNETLLEMAGVQAADALLELIVHRLAEWKPSLWQGSG